MNANKKLAVISGYDEGLNADISTFSFLFIYVFTKNWKSLEVSFEFVWEIVSFKTSKTPNQLGRATPLWAKKVPRELETNTTEYHGTTNPRQEISSNTFRTEVLHSIKHMH